MADTELIIRIAAQDSATRSVQRLQSSIIRLVGAVASLTAAFKAVSFPTQEAIAFERALKDIQKTTEFTDDAIESLGVSLRELATETGVAATELAEIAARAGQLGLGREGQDAILEFTDTIARFAVVADLSVDQAATSIARISNIFKLPIDQSEQVSAAINELSNTTTATAEQLIDVVRRVGDAQGLLEFADTAALAAQALELGQTPEVAGTAIIKTFSNAQTKAEEFADVLNITTREWAALVQRDGVGAIQQVATSIAALGTLEQGVLIKELFGGGRQFAFGAKLVQDAANDFQILDRTLRTAADSYREGTSAIEEYDRITDSTQRQIERLSARLNELAIQFGDVLLPVVRDAVESLNEFLADEIVQARLQAFAESLANGLEAFVEFVAELGKSEDAFENFFAIVKTLAGLGLASLFLSAAGAVARLTSRLVLFVRVLGQSATSLRDFSGTVTSLATGSTAAQVAARRAAGETAATVASGQRTVNALTREQIQLQAERNRLSQSFLATRKRLVREGVREAQAQGQGFQAQLRRARAVRDAVNTGAARGRGDQQILDNLNRQIAVVDTRLEKAGSTAGRFAARFGSLGAVFRTVGGTILRFLGGPIGLLISIFGGVLINTIGNFFNFLDDEVSEGGARALASAREQLEETRKLIGAFREEINNSREVQELTLDVGIDQFEQGLGRAVDGVIAYGNAAEGGKRRQDQLRESAVQFNREIEANNRAIAEQENIIERTRAALGDISGADRIQEAETRISNLRNANERLTASLTETNQLISDTGAVALEFGANQATQIRQIARFVDDNALATLQAQRDVADLTEFLEQKNAEAERLREQINSEDAGDAQQVAALESRLANTTTIIAQIENRIQSVNKEIIDGGTAITNNVLAPQLKALTDVEKVSRTTFDSIVAAVDDANDTGVDAFAGLRDDLLEAAVQAEIFGRQTEVFAELAERVNDTKNSIEGLADNLESSIRASRRDIGEFNRELDQLTKDRDINLRLNQLQDIEEGFGDRQIQRIEENAQRRIDAIDTSTAAGRRLVRGIENERDARVSALRVQQEDIATKRQLQELDEDRVRSLNELERLIEESGKLEKEIDDNRAASTPEEVRQQNIRLEKASALARAIVNEREELQKLTEAQRDFAGTVAVDPFNPDAFEGRRFAISDDEIERIGEEFEAAANRSFEAQTTITTEAEESAKRLANAAEQMSGFAESAKEAEQAVTRIAEKLNIDPNNLRLIREEIRRIVDSVPASSVTLAEQVAAAFETAAIDQIEIAPASLAAIEEDIQQIATGETLQEITNDILIASGSATQEGIEEGAERANPELQFDPQQIRQSLQEAIGTEPYLIQLDAGTITIDGQPIGGNAEGGYIRGPGGPKSDSILSWLSNGEYVIDAATTRRFGAGFFRSLQRGRFSIPGFQNGGPVGADLTGALNRMLDLSSRSPTEEVTVNFNAGGESARLSGDREQVAAFQRALRNVSRGRSR